MEEQLHSFSECTYTELILERLVLLKKFVGYRSQTLNLLGKSQLLTIRPPPWIIADYISTILNRWNGNA